MFTFIIRESMEPRTTNKHEVVIIPFNLIQSVLHEPDHFQWFLQIALNVVLFIPFGFMLPIINQHNQSFFTTLFYGFLFSFAIEVMQYITGRGLADIDDLINNTLGAVIGYLIYRAGKKEYDRKRNSNKLSNNFIIKI